MEEVFRAEQRWWTTNRPIYIGPMTFHLYTYIQLSIVCGPRSKVLAIDMGIGLGKQRCWLQVYHSLFVFMLRRLRSWYTPLINLIVGKTTSFPWWEPVEQERRRVDSEEAENEVNFRIRLWRTTRTEQCAKRTIDIECNVVPGGGDSPLVNMILLRIFNQIDKNK